MQLTKNQFRSNLLTTIEEEGMAFDRSKIKFVITPVKEANVKYDSIDDSARLWMLTEANLKDRYFNLDEVVDFLSLPNQRFPFWIKILLKETQEENLIFELQISMRYRTPTQLKYIETGHPPFVFDKGW